jgi:hypothetical protein
MSKEDNLIPFKKGHKRIMPDPEKQKAKKALKVMLTTFAEDNFEEFEEEWHKLKGKAKCDVYIKALEFVQPRISSVQFEDLKEARNAVTLLRTLAQYRKDEDKNEDI